MWLSTVKSLLVGQPKVEQPRERGREPQNIGGLAGIFIIIYRKIVDAAAFSIRVFLRRNLGERTFTIWTILFAFLWAWYFVSEGIEFKLLNREVEFFETIAEMINRVLSESQERGTARILFFRSLDHIFWYLYALLYFVYQALQYIDTFIQSLVSPNYFPKASLYAYYYSRIVILLGIITMIINWRKSTITREKVDSYYRGDSIFFNWLSLVDIRIRGAKIVLDKAFVWLFLEPVLVFLLGATLWYSGIDQNFSLFLMLSAIALFLEEQREHQISRAEVLDVVDAEFKADKLDQSLGKLKEATADSAKALGAVLSRRSK